MKFYSTKSINDRMRAEKPFSDFVSDSIRRFLSGDFGNISETDKQLNLSNPDYQMGAYTYCEIVKIWIKKDLDFVTVLFPNEY